MSECGKRNRINESHWQRTSSLGVMKCWPPELPHFIPLKMVQPTIIIFHKRNTLKYRDRMHLLFLIIFVNLSEVFKNSGCVVEDLGDGILNLEFQSKMNTIGGDVFSWA